MVISNVAQLVVYSGNGSNTGPFPFAYPYNEAADLVVTVDGVDQTLSTHYTVTSTGTDTLGKNTGANINFITAPAAGTSNITIKRQGDYLQDRAISGLSSTSTTDLEVWFDDMTMQAQDAKVLAEETSSAAIDAAVAASVIAAEAAVADDVATVQAAVVSTASFATAAETSKILAETAQTGAETAETNAETAQTNAETAQTASETARDLAQEWAANNEDVAVTGTSGTGFSAKHYSIKTEALLDSLNDLTGGVYLTRVVRESPDGNNYNFSSVPGGNYLVNCGNLTIGQKVTCDLFGTPDDATINRFEVKAEKGKEFHLDGGTKEIEGHESTTAFMEIHGYLELAFDSAKDKWVIYEKERV